MAINMEDYQQKFLEDYNRNDFEVVMTKYRKENIKKIISKYSTNRMLEIGCGIEPFFLTYDAFEKMTIIEPATIMYDSAVKYAGEKNKNIRLVQGFVEDKIEELSTEKYDFILQVGLIHEVENPDTLLEATKKLCSKETKCLIVTNNPKSFHLLLAYEAGLIDSLNVISERAKNFQRHNLFSIEEMEDMLKRCGFKILEKGSFFVKPFAHSQMKALIDNNIISDAVLDGLDAMIKYIPDMGAENYWVVEPR